MNNSCLRCSLVCLALWSCPTLADAQSLKATRLTPSELTWSSAGGCTQQATIAGDRTASGLYATRAKLEPGCKGQPHFHLGDRIIVVLSGTLYVGFGPRFDETQLKALPAGSIWTEPAKQPHFVWAKDGEVVIQSTGIGPFVTIQVPAAAP